VLGLLLNSSTSTFCFPSSLNADTPLEATLLTERLFAENPPDLRCIVIKDAEETWNVHAFVETKLGVFINLNELRLENFVCEDSDLIQIADLHLPQLR
jgi:hypothetical protein